MISSCKGGIGEGKGMTSLQQSADFVDFTNTLLVSPVYAPVSNASVNVQPRSQGVAHEIAIKLLRGTREGSSHSETCSLQVAFCGLIWVRSHDCVSLV